MTAESQGGTACGKSKAPGLGEFYAYLVQKAGMAKHISKACYSKDRALLAGIARLVLGNFLYVHRWTKQCVLRPGLVGRSGSVFYSHST